MSTKTKWQQHTLHGRRVNYLDWMALGRCPLAASLCADIPTEMADISAGRHVSQKSISAAIESISQCHADISSSDIPLNNVRFMLNDLLDGASFSLNPLPVNSDLTFYISDGDALHSDWVTAASDLDVVWRAISFAHEQMVTSVASSADDLGGEDDGPESARPDVPTRGQSPGVRKDDVGYSR
jgi:hypothetical protein